MSKTLARFLGEESFQQHFAMADARDEGFSPRFGLRTECNAPLNSYKYSI